MYFTRLLLSLLMGSFTLTTLLALWERGQPLLRVRLFRVLNWENKSPVRAWLPTVLARFYRTEPPDICQRLIPGMKFQRAGLGEVRKIFLNCWWLTVIVIHMAGMLWLVSGGVDFLRGLLVLILSASVLLGPMLYLKYRISRRTRALTRAFPDFLDLLSMSVRAGLGFLPALKRAAAAEQGIINREVGRVIEDMERGFSRKQALDHWAARVQSEDVRRFAEAVQLSSRLGTPLYRTLRIQVNLLRARRRRRAEIKAQTTPIRIVPALVFFFLPSLLLIYLAPPLLNFFFRR